MTNLYDYVLYYYFSTLTLLTLKDIVLFGDFIVWYRVESISIIK
jgi:hypothetical protein